mmetsp:Transcript_25797/g.43296  ORF Transcript_25797/g.43296 Transcript_25797/m.43296 type:complete len:219 (-) Transcript_25797:2001-2657(-)
MRVKSADLKRSSINISIYGQVLSPFKNPPHPHSRRKHILILNWLCTHVECECSSVLQLGKWNTACGSVYNFIIPHNFLHINVVFGVVFGNNVQYFFTLNIRRDVYLDFSKLRGAENKFPRARGQVIQAKGTEHIPSAHLSIVFVARKHICVRCVQFIQHLADTPLCVGGAGALVSCIHTHVQLMVNGLIVVCILAPADLGELGHFMQQTAVPSQVVRR